MAKKSGLGTAAFFEQDDQPPHQRTSTPAHQPTSTPASENIKATYYIHPATADDLESAWVKLRRIMAGVDTHKRKLVTKSFLVESALRAALDDLEQNGTDSMLAKEIARL